MTNYTIDYHLTDAVGLQQERVVGDEFARVRAQALADSAETLGQASVYFSDGDKRQGELAFVAVREGWA